MQTFEELEKQVIQWAEDRDILKESDPKSQLLKTMSELGELADAVNECDFSSMDLTDAFGDVLVTLILLDALLHQEAEKEWGQIEPTSLALHLQFAYNEIKDRKGTMVNGVFVKEAR